MCTIHRDVKAANILLGSNAQVKLADFGVSKHTDGTMAQQHTIIGTPHWMAPEVISGSGHDTRADIWSVGVTLIELCEGEPPNSQLTNPLAAMLRIVNGPAPTLYDQACHTAHYISGDHVY